MKHVVINSRSIIGKYGNRECISSFAFKFKTREEYIEFVAEWKVAYHDRVRLIRETKVAIKEAQAAKQYAGSLQSSLLTQKFQATELIALRKASRIEANRQWQLSKQQPAVA